jgi:predicted TIM-barrel fold metal-dependent hydrolase
MIDAHVHLWDRERFRYDWLDDAPELPRRALPEELGEAAPDVGGFVLVQADCAPAEGLDEARWFDAVADDWDRIAGIVAFAPLEDAGVESQLEQLAAMPRVVGVRRLLQSEGPDFLEDPGLDRGLDALAPLGLSFDACVRWPQLPALVRLAARHPQLVIVLDHLGKPPVVAGFASDEGRLWARSVTELARLENVAVKLSGLPAEAPAGTGEPAYREWVEHALQAFGADRAMFGSDWPVSATPELDHAGWTATVVDALGPSDDELRAVFEATAMRVYGLPTR